MNKQDLYTAAQAIWALQRGYLFISVNHRLANFDLIAEDNPDINDASKRIMIDRIDQDATDAIVWIYKNIKNYGGNPDNMLLFGFSSGADIVARIGVDNKKWANYKLPKKFIKGVVVGDISSFDIQQNIFDEKQKFIKGEKNIYHYYLNVFGLDENYWKKYSAYEKIDSATEIPPYFFIRTDEKYLIQNKKITDAFIQKLKNKNTMVTDVLVENTEHHEVYRLMLTNPNLDLNKKLTNFINNSFNN